MTSIQVLFFGKLAGLVQEAEFQHEIEPGTRVADLYEQFTSQSQLQPLAQKPNIKVAVNQQLVGWDWELSPGDELAFLPPVTGG
ncbi:MAG: MoaD/ThiS family protein [Pseudomonadales bacterium]